MTTVQQIEYEKFKEFLKDTTDIKTLESGCFLRAVLEFQRIGTSGKEPSQWGNKTTNFWNVFVNIRNDYLKKLEELDT